MNSYSLVDTVNKMGRAKRSCAPNKLRGQTGLVGREGSCRNFSGASRPTVFAPSTSFLYLVPPLVRGHFTNYKTRVWLYIKIWQLTDLNVTVHVFYDYNLEIILNFAVLELWLIQV